MPNYRRYYIPGGTFFFTLVSYGRSAIFTTPQARSLLRSAWVDVKKRFPFSTIAICLLPDHFHCIWTLPEGDTNFSLRWREIKRLFTKGFLQEIGPGAVRNASRVNRNEAAIWQRRFWEHTIRDEADLAKHIDYIHFNPVKHNLVAEVEDWPWSSYHKFVRLGYYGGCGSGRFDEVKDLQINE